VEAFLFPLSLLCYSTKYYSTSYEEFYLSNT
jgi:hypothetical protein